MKKKLKKISKFKSEKEEREFWLTHDTTEYIDYSKAKQAIFPDLKPTSQTISMRIPTFILSRLKVVANKKDVPYQSLIKIYITEKLKEEETV